MKKNPNLKIKVTILCPLESIFWEGASCSQPLNIHIFRNLTRDSDLSSVETLFFKKAKVKKQDLEKRKKDTNQN